MHVFSLVFELDTFVLTKNGLYMGKGYECRGMFKLNVPDVKPKLSKIKNVSSIDLIDSLDLWDGILRHVNYNTM